MSSTPCASACSSRNEPVPALQTRFMSASTTRPPSTLMNLASWPPISTMERLRPPSGSSRAAATACATISFSTVRRSPSSGKAARNTAAAASRPEPGDADGHDARRQPLADLRDQRLRRLHGVSLGAAVDAGQGGARREVEQRGLGAGGAEVEAEHGRSGERGRRRCRPEAVGETAHAARLRRRPARDARCASAPAAPARPGRPAGSTGAAAAANAAAPSASKTPGLGRDRHRSVAELSDAGRRPAR